MAETLRYDGFLHEFEELLQKYDAEFEVGDDGRGHGMHSPLAIITFYDPYEEYILPKWIDGRNKI